MRLTFSLLASLSLSVITATATSLDDSHQTPFHPPPPIDNPTPVHTTSTSLVDLLSASSNHTLLLQAFQRARLIPVLNRLNGSTLFAPTDEAIKAAREKERTSAAVHPSGSGMGVWTYAMMSEEYEDSDQSARPPHDNLQLELRDALLYHLLNYTIFPPPPSPPSNDSTPTDPPSLFLTSSSSALPELHETLLHPSLSPYNKSFPAPPSLPGSPPDNPDPDHPSKNIEGLLRGRGQRVRIMKRKGGEMTVGTDWEGNGGSKVVEGSLEWGTWSSLVSLEEVLERPVDLATQIRNTPSLSTFATLLPPEVLDYVSTASHLTIFAPTNDAWGQLSELEMRYLRSGFAQKDLTEIFGDAASTVGAGDGAVGYIDVLLGKNRTGSALVPTFYESEVLVEAGGEGSVKPVVNGTAIETPDILASNGVLHTVPSLLLPSGSLSLTAEKYLIALNCTKFVALLRSVNLSHYVQIETGEPTISPYFSASSKGEAYTILAPQDSVIDTFLANAAASAVDPQDHGGLPEPGTEALREVLEYHLVSGRYTAENLKDGMLVGTELRPESLAGARQRLVVSVQSAEIGLGRWVWEQGKKGDQKKVGVVGFGGASVVADPVRVGNSIIYLLASVLEPPTSLVTTAVSDLRLSTFVASIYAASLDKLLSKAPAITYLVPSNDAFASLGLVMSYLLLPTSRNELRSVLRYHAIDELVYLDDFPVGGSVRYPTLLDGAEVYVERSSFNASLAVHGPTVGGHPVNGETRDGRVVEGDVLTSTGVMHMIDQVELPPSLDIGIAKLLKGARANTMVDLIRAANMSWVLEGKQAPEEFYHSLRKAGGAKGRKNRVGRFGVPSKAYTVLCPTDKALSRLTLTYYLSDPVALSALVRLHIIPTDAFAPLAPEGQPLPLADEATFPTLLDVAAGGESQYGALAFRRWGEEGWLVGIKSARGTDGGSDSARVVTYGRATPYFLQGEGDSTKLASGGGVLTIDSVLIPYYPNWFRRWGWIVLTVVLSVAATAIAVLLIVRLWRKKKVTYERVEGEED